MANEFTGNGNLAEQPSIKYATVGGEQRPVCEMRVFFDEYKRDKQTGELEQSGGFWLSVSAWGELAERCAELLKRGTRIHVVGNLKREVWADKNTGEEREAFRLVASEVYLALGRLESVTFRARQEQAV